MTIEDLMLHLFLVQFIQMRPNVYLPLAVLAVQL